MTFVAEPPEGVYVYPFTSDAAPSRVAPHAFICAGVGAVTVSDAAR